VLGVGREQAQIGVGWTPGAAGVEPPVEHLDRLDVWSVEAPPKQPGQLGGLVVGELGLAGRKPHGDGSATIRCSNGPEAHCPFDEQPPVRVVVVRPTVASAERRFPDWVRREGQGDRRDHPVEL
jgi:hypothetical protein